MSSKDDSSDDQVREDLERLEDLARQVPDDRETLGRGPDALRDHLRHAAQRKKQLTIRLDRDIVERFKELAGPDGSYQTLMNRALHEWLEAQSVSGLLRAEIKDLGEIVHELKSERAARSSGDRHH